MTIIPDVMSGRKTSRLYGRAAAIAAIQAGLADVLVLKDFDRATRDARDGLDLMKTAKDEGWRVLTTKGEDTDAIGQLEMTIKLAFAEEERRKISERTMAGMARARRQGTKSGKPIGKPSRIPGEIVDRIAALSENGLGAKAIARQLMDDGVPSPSGGVTWHYSTVRGVVARLGAA